MVWLRCSYIVLVKNDCLENAWKISHVEFRGHVNEIARTFHTLSPRLTHYRFLPLKISPVFINTLPTFRIVFLIFGDSAKLTLKLVGAIN